MRRLVVLTVAALMALGFASSAAAAGPNVSERVVFEDERTLPAGAFCEFAVHETFYTVVTFITWGDPRVPTKRISAGQSVLTYTNLATGYTLTGKAGHQSWYDYWVGRYREMGIFFHLRNADGEFVVVEAGMALYEYPPGTLLKVTPNYNPDQRAVLCAALEG